MIKDNKCNINEIETYRKNNNCFLLRNSNVDNFFYLNNLYKIKT